MRATVVGSEPLGAPGGVESVVRLQIRALEEAGIDVTYVACGECGHLPVMDRISGRPLAPFACLRCRERPRPDIVLSNGPVGLGFHGSMISAHMYHGTYPGQAAAIRPFIRRRGFLKLTHYDGGVLERLSGKGKICLANSPSTATEVKARFGHDCHVIWCPVDTDTFVPGPRDHGALSALGVAREGPLVVLFVGVGRPTKGPDTVLATADLVPEVEWIFVGAAVPPETPRRAVPSVPPQQMASLLRSVDLVVAPSRYESFGVLAAEALASGTPVLTTRNGLTEFLLEHEVELPWLPPGIDAELLATRVRDACGRLDELRKLSLAAREPLAEHLCPAASMGSLQRALGVRS